jgi:tetratricopeptide (TPR) repeat protein
MEDDALTPYDSPLSHTTQPIPGAVGDNYPGYYIAHFGYQYDVEELMSPGERALKAQLTRIGDDELTHMLQDTSMHNPLEWMHMAHACIRLQRTRDAMELLERVLGHTPYHAGVAYDEVCGTLAQLALDLDDRACAERSITRGQEMFGDQWDRAPWWGGVLAWSAQIPGEAMELWVKYVTREDRVDPERAYDVAAWLVRGEQWDEAHKEAACDFLERSEQAADAQGMRAVLVDIELLRQRLR